MEAVTAVELLLKLVGMLGIARGRVEVCDGIEDAAGKDPLVHRFALFLFLFREVVWRFGVGEG